MSSRHLRFRLGHISAIALCIGLGSTVLADPPAKGAATAWTLDEALQQLAHHPSDPYLQYVALQLAHRENRGQEVYRILEQRGAPGLFRANGRRASADLFSTFTGALAVQESLQLDTMRGERPGRDRDDGLPPNPIQPKGPVVPPKVAPKKLPEKVSIERLVGPTVRSHPWEKMLGARKPEVGTLANCVPEEFYLAEFRSVAKLNDIAGLSELWAGHIFTQAMGESRSQATLERIKKQLGMFELPPTAIEALEIEGIAVTGSDLFLAEGSDITVLVQSQKLPQLLQIVDGVLKSRGKWANGMYLDVEYTHYTSNDGTVDVYSANPRPNLHVRGNSLTAFKRVLETIVGKNPSGKPVRRLGESAEFQFVRTLVPRGAPEEDGFIYLSDSFIRNLVGPRIKLTEQRRILVYNHLRMIGHAALMFRTETGKAPKSLEELAESRCAPGVFGKGKLAHPDGGAYSLSADGMSGVCSKYGRVDAMSPCIEHWLTEVSGEEAEDYKDFVREYSEYWKTYFDPIVIRIKASEKQYRLETLILPLIDNSIYTAMAAAIGGKTVDLDALPAGQNELGGIWLHFNKQQLVDVLGPETVRKTPKEKDVKQPASALATASTRNYLKQLAISMDNYRDMNNRFPPAGTRNKDGKPLLSWRVAILPFIEQEALYKEFKLDEPWDSEHNKKLIEKMPKIFESPNQRFQPGKTTFLVPVGKETIFPPDGKAISINDITDGTANTILIVQANEDSAVVWTKPDDLMVNMEKPLRGLERKSAEFFLAAMADGSVQNINLKVHPVTLRAAFTRNGNEILGELDQPAEKPRPKPATNRPKTAGDQVDDFKQIGIAMHIYTDGMGRFPPASVRNKAEKPLLSWRVALLPYLEEGELFKEFHMNESWDSEHNKKLIQRMPRIYKGLNQKLNGEFKTTFVVPVGKETMFPPDGKAIKLTDVTDGTSNTIMALQVNDDSAVIWTKPDDLNVDLANPLKGLDRPDQAGFLTLLGDGAVRHVRLRIGTEKMAALLTRAGGEPLGLTPDDEAPLPGQSVPAPNPFNFMLDERDIQQLEDLGVDINKLRRFLRDGIGDQIGLQMHDASKLFDFDTAAVLGGRERNGVGLSGSQAFGIGMAVQFLTGPFSISIPVKDRKAVDEFLEELDRLGAKNKTQVLFGLGRLEEYVEFYRVPFGEHSIRCWAIKFAGLKWRLYWGRIGDGLYIVNRPFILEDIAAAQARKKEASAPAEPAHAMLKLRPQNWKQVLPVYNLGWAEAHRSACHNNLSMIANVNRGWNDKRPKSNEPDKALYNRVSGVYGSRPFCADGGNYVLAEDGKSCRCTIHGTDIDPRQLAAPAETSPTGRLLKSLAGVSAALTFSDESLRVVVTIDRKP